MTARSNTPPALEPSPEAVKAARDRLREKGVNVSEELVRDALRGVLAIEASRIERRSREAAAACLLRVQDATREALAMLAQPNDATLSIPAVLAAATSAAPSKPPAGKPSGPPPRRDTPVNLAEIVRRRLGDEAPGDDAPDRPISPPTPPPSPARSQEPRRPVFKRPRGR
jgi:hypothetical protein